MASVRYIVADVDEAAAFYRDNLDFKIDKHNPGKFAALLRDDLTLYLSTPGAGSGGQAGGWSRHLARRSIGQCHRAIRIQESLSLT